MSQDVRPGDWQCACGNNNFSYRVTCKMCNVQRPTISSAPNTVVVVGTPHPSVITRPGDWSCACGELNFASRIECRKCKTQKKAASQGALVIDPSKQLPTTTTTTTTSTAGGAPVEEVKSYYLSVDIERTGCAFIEGILAIGVCFGSADGTVIEQRAFCAKVPVPEDFDEDCWNEFWSKHTDVLDRIDAAATPTPFEDFYAFLLELESKYGPFGRKYTDKVRFKYLSDNPGYDIGHLSVLAYQHNKRLHLQEMFTDYVNVADPTEQIRGLPAVEQARVKKACEHVPHDHWPVNDATKIFHMQCAVDEAIRRYK